ERGEHARVIPHRGGDVSAVVSGQARADEVVGVARVGPGARGAAGGAAVAAGKAKASAGLHGGGVVVQGLAGGRVLVEGAAGEVDGIGAAAGAADLVFPSGVIGGRGDAEEVAESGRVEQRSMRGRGAVDRKSTRLNSSHVKISYAVFCLK